MLYTGLEPISTNAAVYIHVLGLEGKLRKSHFILFHFNAHHVTVCYVMLCYVIKLKSSLQKLPK